MDTDSKLQSVLMQMDVDKSRYDNLAQGQMILIKYLGSNLSVALLEGETL
jgi:hypothetical protein